jgi:hypothetical protein
MVVCGSIGYMIFLHGIPPRSESHGASRFVRTAMEDWLPGPTARP